MANGAADVARLDNWFWTPSPPARDVLSGEIFDDPPPRSWPDGAYTTTSNVSELEQRGAAEGKIIVTTTGRRYLLGKRRRRMRRSPPRLKRRLAEQC